MILEKLNILLEEMKHTFILKSDEDVRTLINSIVNNQDLYSDKSIYMKTDPRQIIPILKMSAAEDVKGTYYSLINTLNWYITTSLNKQLEISIN